MEQIGKAARVKQTEKVEQIEQIEQIRELIRRHHRFVLTGHVNPDADAIGACYGLGMALEKLGKCVHVVLEPYVSKFDIIPGKHLCYTGLLSQLKADVLFCLDCGDRSRLGEAEQLLDNAGVVVCVDHHMTNTGYAALTYLKGEASSTCELVYTLIAPEVVLDSAIASALYAGIVHDTDGFRFSTASPETMHIAGQLMRTGISHTEIYTELLQRRTFTETKLLGSVLSACVRAVDDRVVYACVTQTLLDACGAQSRDLDGVAANLLNVRGAEAAALLYVKPNTEIKVSLRSRDADISRVAAALGGGGHRQAAAANAVGDMNEIVKHVLDLLEQELNRRD